jgi:pilus assembly protein Flp/PilA
VIVAGHVREVHAPGFESGRPSRLNALRSGLSSGPDRENGCRLVNLFRPACAWLKVESEKGTASIEYGILAALLALVIITVVTTTGTNLTGVFNKVGSQLGGAVLQVARCKEHHPCRSRDTCVRHNVRSQPARAIGHVAADSPLWSLPRLLSEERAENTRFWGIRGCSALAAAESSSFSLANPMPIIVAGP